MHIFDPTKRISVNTLTCLLCMIQVQILLPIDVAIDENVSTEMMWQEMLHYHPEAGTAMNMA
jgi:hypothetical protein